MGIHAFRRNPKIIKLFFLTLACVLSCRMAILPAQAQETVPQAASSQNPGQIIETAQDEEPAGMLIVARYYAKRFKGRKTSSGERYDPNKLTAAHPNLPLGMEVKVINPANNRSVIVTINDRCRKRKELYIDLSRQAAMDLGILRRGKTLVRIIPLEEDDDDEEDDT